MTHVRIIAIALAATSVAAVLIPSIAAAAPVLEDRIVETTDLTVVEPLLEIEVEEEDIIDGVRLVDLSADEAAQVTEALSRFEQAGWPIDNTEVRFDADACDGAVGYHAIDNGHHLVVICLEAEWTILHELGHVWSDLYLDEAEIQAWLDLKGLDAWHADEWSDSGTEHAADTIAFGLNSKLHVPSRIGENDYQAHVEAFEWLFGMSPVHKQRPNSVDSDHLSTTTRITAVNSVDLSVETRGTDDEASFGHVPAGYTFPIACGYDRWHSKGGGYGYEDPRDWVHEGVDIYAYEGTPVISPVAGVVTEARWSDVSGWRIVIEDTNGYRHVMVHLQRRPLVSEGAIVRPRSPVGEVGRTGNASGGGPHLHYEIRGDEGTIDPMPWLRSTGEYNIEAAPSALHTRAASPWASCDSRD